MDLDKKQLLVLINEGAKTFATVVAAIATTATAYYSYNAIESARSEARFAREFAVKSERARAVNKVLSSYKATEDVYLVYTSYIKENTSRWDNSKAIDPLIEAKYRLQLDTMLKSYFSSILELSVYGLVSTSEQISLVNSWLGSITVNSIDKPLFYDSTTEHFINNLNVVRDKLQ